jgi:predicted nucleic acid-binding protein
MTDRSFIDTNILIYAFADTEDVRHEKASALVADLLDQQNACASVQVLKEFHAVATTKVPKPLSLREAAAVIRDLCSSCLIADETVPQLQCALTLMNEHPISIWDASIVAAAEAIGCSRLYTEDLAAGVTIGTVLISNPLV